MPTSTDDKQPVRSSLEADAARKLEQICQEQALRIGERLRSLGASFGTAESCTGGLLSSVITQVPGSSDYFLGGVISYANSVKEKLLGVSQKTLVECGAVSQPCVEEMARGARKLIGTTYALAISGIAGPGGGTKEKPVGTVHIAVASPAGCEAVQILFPGTRDEIRWASVDTALRLLAHVLLQSKAEVSA